MLAPLTSRITRPLHHLTLYHMTLASPARSRLRAGGVRPLVAGAADVRLNNAKCCSSLARKQLILTLGVCAVRTADICTTRPSHHKPASADRRCIISQAATRADARGSRWKKIAEAASPDPRVACSGAEARITLRVSCDAPPRTANRHHMPWSVAFWLLMHLL